MNLSKFVRLTEVALINPGVTKRPDVEELVSFVPMAGVSAETATVSCESRIFGEVRKGYTLFENGDLLLAKITPCFENGKIAQASVDHQVGAGSTEFHVIRPDPDRLDDRYLLHFLRRPVIRQLGIRRMTGSGGQRRVPEAFIAGLELPLPEVSKQREVAAVLDLVGELRSKRVSALDGLNSLAASIFSDVFGDPRSNPNGWRIDRLGSIVMEFRYGTSNKSGAEGRPALRIPNVVGGSLDLTDLKLVSVLPKEFDRLKLVNGDLLFVRTNGNPNYVGRCAVFEEGLVRPAGFRADEYIYASYLIRARLRRETAHPIFIQEYMRSSAGRMALRERCKTSAGQYNLNVESLGSIPVPIPPMELQEEFANRIARLDRLKVAYRTHLGELNNLFASLQDKAFRGEL
ncbi:restriction endonuclease subunit S [Micromonospora sp. NPDC048839]|uniref:restriction endonuclease subunit S n=1 Tax=Micromonospora sp. NPDC048839 TaxID=3155641 RepID=UPI0033F0A2A6